MAGDGPAPCPTPGCKYSIHSRAADLGFGQYCCGLCPETGGASHGRKCECNPFNATPAGIAAAAPPRICPSPGCTYRVHSKAPLDFGYYCCGLCKEQGCHYHGRRCQQVSAKVPVLQQVVLARRRPPASAPPPPPKAPAPPPPPRHPNSAIAAVMLAADRMAAKLSGPLQYEVVSGEGAPVMKEPNKQADELWRLPHGSIVAAVPSGNWLRLTRLSVLDSEGVQLPEDEGGAWAFAGNGLIVATPLQVSMPKRYMEAVMASWQHLPCQNSRVRYKIEWKHLSRAKGHGVPAACPRHNIFNGTQSIISGITLGHELCFRVVAYVFYPECKEGQKVVGPWSEGVRSSPLTPAMLAQRLAYNDPSGSIRGGCEQSGCLAWVGDPAADAQVEASWHCARCGHHYKEHAAVKPATVHLHTSNSSTFHSQLGKHTVKCESVDVLDWPSPSANKIGKLKEGTIYRAVSHGEWHRLDDSSARLSPVPRRSCWVFSPGIRLLPDVPRAAAEPPVPHTDFPVAFICAPARSGTNLLVDLLGMHSDITPAFETDFVTHVALLLSEERYDFPAFCEEVLGYMDTWTGRYLASPAAPADSLKRADELYYHGFHYLRVDRDEALRITHAFLDELRVGRPTLHAFRRFCTRFFIRHRRNGGKKKRSMILNKTPNYVLILPILAAMYPEAKFLHCVRDGRDVACSLVERGISKTLGEAAMWWLERTELAVRWGLGNPDRYCAVRYEDLVGNTQAVLSRVLSWLGVADEAHSMLEQRSGKVGGITELQVGRWRRADQAEQARIRVKIQSALVHFGYDSWDDVRMGDQDTLAELPGAEGDAQREKAEEDAVETTPDPEEPRLPEEEEAERRLLEEDDHRLLEEDEVEHRFTEEDEEAERDADEGADQDMGRESSRYIGGKIGRVLGKDAEREVQEVGQETPRAGKQRWIQLGGRWKRLDQCN